MTQARCCPFWTLGTHLPTSSFALAQAEIVAGLHRGHVAKVASTWQQGGKWGSGSGSGPGFPVTFADYVLSGMGSQFQSRWFIWICFLLCLERSLDPTSYLPWGPSSEQRSALHPPPPPSSFCGFGLKAWTLASALLSEFRHLPYLCPSCTSIIPLALSAKVCMSPEPSV